MRFPDGIDHDDDDAPAGTAREMTDDQFFDWIAEGLRRKRLVPEPKPRKTSTAQLVFTYTLCWLLGSAVILALFCGVVALAKTLFALVR